MESAEPTSDLRREALNPVTLGHEAGWSEVLGDLRAAVRIFTTVDRDEEVREVAPDGFAEGVAGQSRHVQVADEDGAALGDLVTLGQELCDDGALVTVPEAVETTRR